MDHIRVIFNDEERRKELQLEMAAVVDPDAGQHFGRATYSLEGDGPLVFSAFQKLQEVATSCTVQHYPNTHAIARKLVQENPALQQDELEEWAKAWVRPAENRFLHQFNVKYRTVLDTFKYAPYFCPFQVQALQPDAADIERLRIIPFFNDDNTISSLQAELPAYLAAANGCRNLTDEEKGVWWYERQEDLQLNHSSTPVEERKH